MIPQNAEDGHFSKKMYVPEKYGDGIKYISTQPLDSRKRGFGTKDAHKRDEFSNNIRTQQYRETLRKEKLLAETPEEIKVKLTKLLAERASMDSYGREIPDSNTRRTSYGTKNVHQYDIGRSQVTEFDPKSIKDTYYKFDCDFDKRIGTFTKPISSDIGDRAWDISYRPPQFGGKSEVKNFYDKSHINISPY
jgi:hypothetical protein